MSLEKDPGQAIGEIIQAVNETCRKGQGFERLRPLFHEDVVLVPPGFTRHVKGREACLKSYEDACSQMTFHKLEASEEKIDVYGDMAVAHYRYDCIWEYQGKRLEDSGYELQVFSRDAGDWQLAWRTLVPGSRHIESCPVEEGQGGENRAVDPQGDVRRICLNLIETSPVCHLTTIDADGFPQTTAMNNLRCVKEYPSLTTLVDRSDQKFLLYLSTSMQSDKLARIRANPKVSAYFSIPDQFIGLMLGGRIEVVTDQALKQQIWQPGWTLYYPNGPQGPEYGVLRLAPTVAKGWFQGRPFEFKMG